MRTVFKYPAKVALKAILLAGAVFFVAALPAQAQLKFGLKIAPTVAYSRVNDNSKQDVVETGGTDGTDLKYTGDGAGIGFSGGLILDYYLKPNYAVSSGVLYTVKKANVDGGALGTINWNLQLIQIPVTMKLYTNELIPDMKLYFQLGGCLDFVIAQKQKDFKPKPPVVAFDGAPFRAFDASIIRGAGVEYRVAESTTLFGGFSYNRGLLNMITNYGAFNENNLSEAALGTLVSREGGKISKATDRYSLRMDMVSLDLGVKF
jgi:hypothetical protein